jgi:3-hydroxyisobutyrate dehydrogenase-like beta-hydroxyacid dehydrogenase
MDVGFIGLGIMGSRMAANLQRAGHQVTVWTRTPGKAEAFAAEHGATAVGSPREVATASDVVITMVVDGPQVDEVLLGPDGAAEGARDGALFVDMSTIAPTDTRRIGAELEARDIRFMDAPVTGSSPRAEAGTLTIMAAGDAECFERARPLFDVMGGVVLHVGELGQGQMLKLVNNAVAAANAVVLGQALLVAERTGVDLDALVKVMAAGSGGSTMLDLKAGPMREHDFTPLFKTEHMLKDVRHCLEEGQAAGVPFPAAAVAREVLTAAVGRGRGEDDFAAVIEVLEGLAGVHLRRHDP